MDRGELLARIKSALCEAFGDRLKGVILFGSEARGDARPDSDIDVLVSFTQEAHPGLFDIVRMEEELKELFGREVDLVDRRTIERSRNYLRRKAILESARVVYAS